MIYYLIFLTFLVRNINSQICYLEYNIDYNGNDIKSVQGSIEQCCAICDELNNCNVYTWSHDNGGTCFLKNSTIGRVKKKGILSSILSVPTEVLPNSGSFDTEEIIKLLNITSGSNNKSEIIITTSSNNGSSETVGIDKPIIVKPTVNNTVSPIIDNNTTEPSIIPTPQTNNSNKLAYVSIYISLILSLIL